MSLKHRKLCFSIKIYADEAYNYGLLNFLYKTNFEKETRELFEEIISLSPIALAKIKENIKLATYGNLQKSLQLEAKNLIDCTYSKEHKKQLRILLKKVNIDER